MHAVLTVAEVAQYLRIDEQTVYRLLRSGELRGVKAGREWRVHRGILERFARGGDDLSHLLTIDQAASYMSDPKYGTETTTPDEVVSMVIDGALPARMVEGRWLLAREDLDQYISPRDEADIAAADKEWQLGEGTRLEKLRGLLRRGYR